MTNDEVGVAPSPLVQEATRKAPVAWVAAGGRPAVALWCVPLEDGLYVVCGPGEQAAPGLAEGRPATVTLRGDHGGRIVTWPADVARVVPGSEQWDAVAPLVAAKRLNASDTIAEVVDRWAAECTLYRLTASGPPLAAGDTLPDDSLAAPPRPTPAARPTRGRLRGRVGA